MENELERFADSAEATYFLDKLTEMLQDERLQEYCNATDSHYAAASAKCLADARNAFAQVVREIENAE